MVVRNVERYSIVEAVVLLVVLGFAGHYAWDRLDPVTIAIAVIVVGLLFGVAEWLKYRNDTK